MKSSIAWLAMVAIAPVADAQTKAADPAPMSASRAMSYSCNGIDVVARIAPSGLELYLPDRRVVLPPDASAPGTFAEGGVRFVLRREQADLEFGGTSYSPCALDAQQSRWDDARLRGISLRAVGGTPAWSLEIDENRTHETTLVLADGTTIARATPEAVTEGERTRYAMDGLSIVIENVPCTGSGGAPRPAKVAIKLGGRDYAGCGEWLQRGQTSY